MIQMTDLSLCHLLNTVKCCKRSRAKEMFQFEKPRAYAQTLKSKDISAVRLENRGSGAIAPFCFVGCCSSLLQVLSGSVKEHCAALLKCIKYTIVGLKL
jgi:hypothetical protein